jgi:hypothetical protein
MSDSCRPRQQQALPFAVSFSERTFTTELTENDGDILLSRGADDERWVERDTRFFAGDGNNAPVVVVPFSVFSVLSVVKVVGVLS